MTSEGRDDGGNVAESTGRGPGAFTPDGNPVEVYARLPPAEDDLTAVRGSLAEHSDILELGCGAGRLTHLLVGLGHEVVAVDESPEMLTYVRGARTVLGRIQDLVLDRRFDAVLLPSHLIGVPDEETRRGFLRTCRRHVRRDGVVLLQRLRLDWLDDPVPSEGNVGGVTVRMRGTGRPGPGLLSALAEYEAEGMRWRQRFTVRRIGDADLAAALAEADLVVDEFLTPDGTWIRAVPGERRPREPGGG